MALASHPARLLKCAALGAITSITLAWHLWPPGIHELDSTRVRMPTPATFDDRGYRTQVATLALCPEPERLVQCARRANSTFIQYQLRACFRPSPRHNPRQVQWTFDPDEARAVAANPAPLVFARNAGPHPDGWPAWARLGIGGDNPLIGFDACASGWPLPCLSASCRFPAGGGTMRGPSIVLRRATPWTDGILPVIPVWHGLFANTTFFGLAWFGIYSFSAAAQTAHRRRRGRCPACAYDLRRDLAPGCPECGWNRSQTGPAPARILT